MNRIGARIDALDWKAVQAAFERDGHAVLPPLLDATDRARLIEIEADESAFRRRIVMERYRYGAGRYGYFADPPPPVAALREGLYPHLAVIANAMSEALGRPERYPADLAAFRQRCAEAGQTKPTPLLLRYEAGGHNRLHQDIYGPLAFPIQAVMLLSDPGRDFTGGEFLLAETAPRQQTRAEVVPIGLGETVIFPTAERPVPGARAMLRARMRHGVSRVRSGVRYTLGVIFHDAA